MSIYRQYVYLWEGNHLLSSLGHYQSICSALCKLLPSLVEVVLHDLGTGKIAHIEGKHSLRSVGDDSLLETADYQAELCADGTIGPYPKYLADGSKLKTVSAVLQDDKGKDIGLLCINLRIDSLEAAQASLALLASVAQVDPSHSMTKNDWREVVNTVIAEQLQGLQTSIVSARRPERMAIVAALQSSGVFESRGSVAYVSTALGISRASLYKLLKATH